MDFPFARLHRPTIGTWSPEGVIEPCWRLNGSIVAPVLTLSPGSSGWFFPFKLDAPFLVTKLWWVNGSTITGNVDVGVYTGGANPALLCSTGATAQAGSTALQLVTLGTPVLLGPGAYYWSISTSAGGTIAGASAQQRYGQALGVAVASAANHPLGASPTLASISTYTNFLFGMSHAGVF